MSQNFASRSAQANLANKNYIAALIKKTDFDDKLKYLNKKVTSSKTKLIEAEKKITDLNKTAQISEKAHDFLLGRMYFISNDGYQHFLVSTPMFSSLISDSHKEVSNWISTGISSGNFKTFDTNLERTMSNLANDRITLKLNNSALVQKKFSSFYSHIILNLYIVYELNNWPRDPTNNFH